MIDPPVPIDADLRHFKNMPLDVMALSQSGLAATGDPADNWYAVKLWCAAWHQVPAGSLPDDERQLAYLAGFGRNLRGWKKHREGALHGFEKATDGRLYHLVLVGKVLEALGMSDAGRRAANRRWAARNREAPEKQQNTGCDDDGHAAKPALLRSDRIGSERKERDSSLRSVSPKKNSGEAHGTRLPEDWSPTDEQVQWAVDRGFPRADGLRLADQYRDHWRAQPGQKGRKSDWDATWRNWVRKALEITGKTGPPSGDTERALAATRAKMQALDDARCRSQTELALPLKSPIS